MNQIVGINEFINRITKDRLTPVQLRKAAAYLRAKGIVFYDNWSREHCAILEDLKTKQTEVLKALRYTL